MGGPSPRPSGTTFPATGGGTTAIAATPVKASGSTYNNLNQLTARSGCGTVSLRISRSMNEPASITVNRQSAQVVANPTGGVYYFSFDLHGSIREVTDSSRSVVANYKYEAYGNPTNYSGGLVTDFGFDGCYYPTNARAFRPRFSQVGQTMCKTSRTDQDALILFLHAHYE